MPNKVDSPFDLPSYLYDDSPPQYAYLNGAVICNRPVNHRHYGYPGDASSEKIALDAIRDWNYYGGFLVCESCPVTEGQRIVDSLNFCQGLSDEFIHNIKFKQLLSPSEEK